MIAKGIIKTIDFLDNSCTVRLPIFETAAADGEVVLKATLLTQPGMYNGYVEGDIVFVDFENDKLSQPVVLGKLYLGATKEEMATPTASLSVANLKVASKAVLPIDTQLELDDVGAAVPVENGITSYKSLTDIIKALYKAESSVGQVIKDQSEMIANIKVEYLSQPVEAADPTADDPNWQLATPVYKDKYAIWQKTTCFNSRGEILNIEIICLTGIASSAIYSIRCSTKVHAGTSQTEALIIKAVVKFGTMDEILDDAATLVWRWSNEAEEDARVSNQPEIWLLPEDLEDQNLLITLKHGDTVYATETIMFAPLNTPVLLLSKDTDVILYTADGSRKLGNDVTVSASLYVNGNPLGASYVWTNDEYCTGYTPLDDNDEPISQTFVITGIDSTNRVGTATCAATVTQEGPFYGKTYTKNFSVTQTRVGENATSYWLASSCTVHTGRKHGKNISVTAMKQFGTSQESPDTAAFLWWKYLNAADDPNTSAVDESKWKLAATPAHQLNIAEANILNDDILIIATHEAPVSEGNPTGYDPNESLDLETDPAIYLKEEITFSPLNTPILSLTKDSGALVYGSDGNKMYADDVFTTTAELYLNGTKLPDSDVTYTWALTDCHQQDSQTDTTATGHTINIKYLDSNTTTATCTATYKGESYSKACTIAKQIQGISVVLQTTYYALIHYDYTANTIATPPSIADLQVKKINPEGAENAPIALIAATEITGGLSDDTEVIGGLNEDTGAYDLWTPIPPEHIADTNGWKYWTTIETLYSTGVAVFSTPIINEDLSGVYALALGKTTNYYGDTDPAGTAEDKLSGTYGTALSSQKKTLKEGDCWFDTGSHYVQLTKKLDPAVKNDGTFGTKAQYIGYYYNSGTLASPEYQKITGTNLDAITENSTIAYKLEQNCLRQWTVTETTAGWEDVGNELVANKVTANYINALDITAKKIKILDTDNTTLFEADGLDGAHKVQIGGFDVVGSTLTTGSADNNNLITLSGNTDLATKAERLTIGDNFKVLADGTVHAKNLYLLPVESGEGDGEDAASKIAAISAELNHIEVKDDSGNIIFKADGREGSESKGVKIGGFEVTPTSILSGAKQEELAKDPTLTLKDIAKNYSGVYIGPEGLSIGKGFTVYSGDDGKATVANVELTEEQITAFTPTVYWLASTCATHTGTKHGSDIIVTAMKKEGGTTEEPDVDAYLWWKYKSVVDDPNTGANEGAWRVAANQYWLNFTWPAEVINDDIVIIATHNGEFDPNDEGVNVVTDTSIYEREEIPFSPDNSPILNLTNDSAAITYAATGEKLGNGVATTRAELWLNGAKIPDDDLVYSWTLYNCHQLDNKTDTSATGAEISIKYLDANLATATCEVNYKDERHVKTFTIVKQIQGEHSVSYWLNLSSGIHAGTNQKTAISASAMKKIGTDTAEVRDTAAVLEYSFDGTNWTKVSGRTEGGSTYYDTFDSSQISGFTFTDADLLIRATHNGVEYDTETITYSPLNTPVIDLSNDTATILYSASGTTLLGDPVSSTATLYLNGDPLPATSVKYSWAVTDCGVKTGTTTSGQTITIATLSANTAKATCTAKVTADGAFKNKEYTKAFTISKTRKGDNGQASTSYWLNCSAVVHSGADFAAPAITVTPMKQVGTGTEGPDSNAKLYYRYATDTSWSGGGANTLSISSLTRKNADLYILATHKPSTGEGAFTPSNSTTATDPNIYDWETIPYAPPNSPVLDLSNDNASISYDGTEKLGSNVSSTARLYLGNEVLPTIAIWQLESCTTSTASTITWSEREGTNKTVPYNQTIQITGLSANTAKATCWAFTKLWSNGEPEIVVYRPNFTEANWATYGVLGHAESWTNAPKVTAGNYFVVLGKSTDTNATHVLWYQSVDNAAANAYGACISHEVFYEKEFTITKQLRGAAGVGDDGAPGRSVVSTTTYYALTTTKPSVPTSKTPNSTTWKTSPDSYPNNGTTPTYYQVTRTDYSAVDEHGKDYSWSNVIEQTLLDTDFINALGITAKKLTVKSNKRAVSVLDLSDQFNLVELSGVDKDGKISTASKGFANPTIKDASENAAWLVNGKYYYGRYTILPSYPGGTTITTWKNSLGLGADTAVTTPGFAILKVVFNKAFSSTYVAIKAATASNNLVSVTKLNATTFPVCYTGSAPATNTAEKTLYDSLVLTGTTTSGTTLYTLSDVKVGDYLYIICINNNSTATGTNCTSTLYLQDSSGVEFTLFEADGFTTQSSADESVITQRDLGVVTLGNFKVTENMISSRTTDSSGKSYGLSLISTIPGQESCMNRPVLQIGDGFIANADGNFAALNGSITEGHIYSGTLGYGASRTIDDTWHIEGNNIESKYITLNPGQISFEQYGRLCTAKIPEGPNKDETGFWIAGSDNGAGLLFTEGAIDNNSLTLLKPTAGGAQEGAIRNTVRLKFGLKRYNNASSGNWLLKVTCEWKQEKFTNGSWTVQKSSANDSPLRKVPLGLSTTIYAHGRDADEWFFPSKITKSLYMSVRAGDSASTWSSSLRGTESTDEYYSITKYINLTQSWKISKDYGCIVDKSASNINADSGGAIDNISDLMVSTSKIQNSAGVLVASGGLLPAYAQTASLGTSAYPWQTAYIKNLYVGNIYSSQANIGKAVSLGDSAAQTMQTKTLGFLETAPADSGNTGSGNTGSGGNTSSGGTTNAGQTNGAMPSNQQIGGNSGSSGGGTSGGGGRCFDAGTQVLMADGTSKNIEEIQVGDLIWSYNTSTKQSEVSEVLSLHVSNSYKQLVHLTFEDGTVLDTTMTHPFYTTSGWVSLDPSYDYNFHEDISDAYFEMMAVGQTFYKANYNTNQVDFVKLSRIQYRHGVSKDHLVYNLNVSNNNTFFANGILGHNIGIKDVAAELFDPMSGFNSKYGI
jgi:hypothetical protein